MKRTRIIWIVVLLIVALAGTWRWVASVRDSNAVPDLTADVRARLHLPSREDHFPQGSLSEALTGVTRPDSVARRLAPLAPLIKTRRLVQGPDFVAQILGLELRTGGVFEIALLYSKQSGLLFDIDAPEYLGETEPVSSQSEIAKYPSPSAA